MGVEPDQAFPKRATSSLTSGEFVPIPTLPNEVILILSVTVSSPSAVVPNSSLPGISLALGVPSVLAAIEAAMLSESVPSLPTKTINPKVSPALTLVSAPAD